MPEDLPEKPAEFQKFEDLARRLFAVPKEELDEEIKKDARNRRRREDLKPKTPKK